VISAAFWLSESGALRSPANDIIRLSEVITSERFGSVEPKYREYAECVHKSAVHLIEVINERVDPANTKNRENDLEQVPAETIALVYELRSILNAIIGFSEIFVKQVFGPVDVQYLTYAENIHASGICLLDMTSDMLTLARLETGNIALDERGVDVARAVQEALRVTIPQATERGVTLTWVSNTADLPKILCDQGCLRQMLVNLLSSAAKFDWAGRLVEVGTDLSDGFSIVIRDTGWGILMDSLRLLVTKGLIERHGGDFSIMSSTNDGIMARLAFPPEHIVQESNTLLPHNTADVRPRGTVEENP
jgi:K+-sensing histidine kinase KdpD